MHTVFNPWTVKANLLYRKYMGNVVVVCCMSNVVVMHGQC